MADLLDRARAVLRLRSTGRLLWWQSEDTPFPICAEGNAGTPIAHAETIDAAERLCESANAAPDLARALLAVTAALDSAHADLKRLARESIEHDPEASPETQARFTAYNYGARLVADARRVAGGKTCENGDAQ